MEKIKTDNEAEKSGFDWSIEKSSDKEKNRFEKEQDWEIQSCMSPAGCSSGSDGG